MPTKNPRLNITLEPNIISALKGLARHENKQLATLAKELILEALDRREDRVLSSLAERRESTAEGTVSHEDAWE